MIKLKRITTLDPQTNVLFYRLPILRIEYFSSEYFSSEYVLTYSESFK